MKSSLLFILIFLSGTAPAQFFEGEIIYKNSGKSKNPNITDKEWTKIIGTKLDYFIKQGSYKSLTNGSIQWQLYMSKTNKLYSKRSDAEAAYWKDAAVSNDIVVSSKITKNAETILGYVCDKLVLTCKSGIYTYYYTKKLPVNAELYKNAQLYNWSYYVSIAKALSLKMRIETPQYTTESIATDVKPMTLDDNLFVLPKGMKTVKSPF